MKSVGDYLENASFGYSENKSGRIFSLKEKPMINAFSQVLFTICEKISTRNTYSPLRKILTSVAKFSQEIVEAKSTRLNPDLIFISGKGNKFKDPFTLENNIGVVCDDLSKLGITTVINPLNGKTYLFHHQELADLLEKNCEHQLDLLDRNRLKELIDSGFIIPKREYLRISSMPENSLNVWLNVGYECPNGCGFCWAGQGSKEKTHRYDHVKEFEESEIDQLTSGIVGSLEYLKTDQVTIKLAGGGEPLVYFKNIQELLPKITSSLKEKSESIEVKYVIITSGIGLTEQMCEFFKENNVYIGLAIGGDELGHWQARPFVNGTSSWQHVKNAINLLIKHENDYNLSMVLCDKNVFGLISDNIAIFRNFFCWMDLEFGEYIPIDFSFARPSEDEPIPIKNIAEFSSALVPLIREYFSYQKFWTGKVDYKKFDYTAISSNNSGKKYTCFAGHSYIGITSFKEPRRILTFFGRCFSKTRFVTENFVHPIFSKIFYRTILSQLSIGACHEISDKGAVYDPNIKQSMLEQANSAFEKKEGKRKKRPYLTPKEARKTCIGCALRYYCSGIDEIGGCTIQRYNNPDVKGVEYCEAYSTSIQEMLIEGNKKNDYTPQIIPIAKNGIKRRPIPSSDLAKQIAAVKNNLQVAFSEMELLKQEYLKKLSINDAERYSSLESLSLRISISLNNLEEKELHFLASKLAGFYLITHRLPSGFENLEKIIENFISNTDTDISSDPEKLEDFISKVLALVVANKITTESLSHITNQSLIAIRS